ncbi:MAG: phosphodiester glycosidase family protein, partial [Hyphomicrobium sp.]
MTFEEQAFTVCHADPAIHDIRLFLKRPDGTNFSQLEALPADGLLFATNAGMFTPEYTPAGLYIENAIERKSLNTRASGYGNFHIQPNGVFWVQDGKAAISTTADYQRLDPSAEIATQSGPMLVVNG